MRYSTSYADPVLKMREHLCFCFCIFLIQLYSAIASACNFPPNAGLEKRANFSTLNIGLSGSGDRTRVTCGAGSGDNCSAINYDSLGSSFQGLWISRFREGQTAAPSQLILQTLAQIAATGIVLGCSACRVERFTTRAQLKIKCIMQFFSVMAYLRSGQQQ
jgi:hypothetical protein